MHSRQTPARKAAPKRLRQTRPGRPSKVSVLFFEHAGAWSAQVLEYDIATQAKTLRQLFHETERILAGYLALAAEEGRKPFEGIPPAPRRYWRLYEASQIVMDRPSVGITTQGAGLPAIRREIRVAESLAA